MTEDKQEFISFEDVITELKLTEEELKRMVSEGEVRAFRDDDKMVFKQEDIDNFKRGQITEPTVMLPPDQLPPSSEEATFTEEDNTSGITEDMPFGDTDITIPSLEEEKVTTPEIEDQQTFVEEGTDFPTASLGDAVETDATFVEDESPATVGPDAMPTVAEEFSETVAEKPAALKPKVPPRRAAMAAPSFTLPPKRVKTHPVFIVILALGMMLMMLTGSFLFDNLRISSREKALPNGVTREIGQVILDIFGIEDISLEKF